MTRLEFFRRRAGLSTKELAARMGIAPANVSAVERGIRKPWPKFKEDSARALNISYADIWLDNNSLDKILSNPPDTSL